MAINHPHGYLGPLFAPSYHRPWLRYVEPTPGAEVVPDVKPAGEPAPTEPAPAAPEPTDWKAEARKWESRAKENHAAAKANEDAAKRLAEIEEANKTEVEKTAERLAAAEKRAAELEVRSIRAEVAAAKGVPAVLLTGSTQEELEASAVALLAFKGEQAKPSAGPFVTDTNKTTVDTDFDAAIAAARKSRDFALVATLRQQQAVEQSKKGS